MLSSSEVVKTIIFYFFVKCKYAHAEEFFGTRSSEIVNHLVWKSGWVDAEDIW